MAVVGLLSFLVLAIVAVALTARATSAELSLQEADARRPIIITASTSLVVTGELQALALSVEESTQFEEELSNLSDCDANDLAPQMCKGDEVRFAGLFLTQHELKEVSRTHITITVGVGRDEATDQVIVFYYEQEGGRTPPGASPLSDKDESDL